ncbi:MAG: hypothetical protein RPU73_11015 [Candidatus Sedimenticola sp. (ex Thyasira tokunagai)]
MFESAFRNGPDGTLDGKHGLEHPVFIHHSVGFYLIGCFAYLEGEDGTCSWKQPSQNNSDFDTFASSNPPSKTSFSTRGITTESLNALVCIRNAIAHNDGDLSKNNDRSSLSKVTTANLPGVVINENTVTLEKELLEFIRVSALAVRQYHGDG